MRRTRRLSAEELSQQLRAWDPTRGDAQLTADERRAIGRTLSTSPLPQTPWVTHRRWPRLALAAGGGLAVALVLLVAWAWRPAESRVETDSLRSEQATIAPPAANPDGGAATAPVTARAVQVQLVASGGTRIVWVLNPELPPLPDELEENSDAK